MNLMRDETEADTKSAYRPGRPWSRLPQVVRDKVLEKHRSLNVEESFWSEGVDDDFISMTGHLGYRQHQLWYSQGEDAGFSGEWAPEHCKPDLLKKEVGGEDGLLPIADRFLVLLVEARVQNLEIPTFDLTFRNDVAEFNFETFEHQDDGLFERELRELSHELMRYFYRNLEAEYAYLTSDEAIVESIEANDYHFNFAGDIV